MRLEAEVSIRVSPNCRAHGDAGIIRGIKAPEMQQGSVGRHRIPLVRMQGGHVFTRLPLHLYATVIFYLNIASLAVHAESDDFNRSPNTDLNVLFGLLHGGSPALP